MRQVHQTSVQDKCVGQVCGTSVQDKCAEQVHRTSAWDKCTGQVCGTSAWDKCMVNVEDEKFAQYATQKTTIFFKFLPLRMKNRCNDVSPIRLIEVIKK